MDINKEQLVMAQLLKSVISKERLQQRKDGSYWVDGTGKPLKLVKPLTKKELEHNGKVFSQMIEPFKSLQDMHTVLKSFTFDSESKTSDLAILTREFKRFCLQGQIREGNIVSFLNYTGYEHSNFFVKVFDKFFGKTLKKHKRNITVKGFEAFAMKSENKRKRIRAKFVKAKDDYEYIIETHDTLVSSFIAYNGRSLRKNYLKRWEEVKKGAKTSKNFFMSLFEKSEDRYMEEQYSFLKSYFYKFAMPDKSHMLSGFAGNREARAERNKNAKRLERLGRTKVKTKFKTNKGAELVTETFEELGFLTMGALFQELNALNKFKDVVPDMKRSLTILGKVLKKSKYKELWDQPKDDAEAQIRAKLLKSVMKELDVKLRTYASCK